MMSPPVKKQPARRKVERKALAKGKESASDAQSEPLYGEAGVDLRHGGRGEVSTEKPDLDQSLTRLVPLARVVDANLLALRAPRIRMGICRFHQRQ